MARIAGVDLPRAKRIDIGLTYIYGIGRHTAGQILDATGVKPETRVKDLTEADATKLREHIERNFQVEGDLRREVQLNVKRLIEIGCYRSHRRNLPVRGQRTRTNRAAAGVKKTKRAAGAAVKKK
jgi:small subunit ribosomal protein S13